MCGDALDDDTNGMRRATKVFLCNATFPGNLNSDFAATLAPEHAPQLHSVATMQPFSDSDVLKNGLQLSRITSVKGTWASGGCPLYVYTRSGVEPAPNPDSVIDSEAVAKMLATRVENDRKAMELVKRGEAAHATAGEVERGAMRTALLAASLG